jgi:long-chain fatty acid transport protein
VAAQISVGPIFAPTGSLGATFIPDPSWRVGVSFQLPVWVNAPATLETRLPSSPLFDEASQQGNAANVKFDLPWMLRAGVETRAVKDLRLELSFEYDRWSMHDSILLTPQNISLNNVAGLGPTYTLQPVTLPRSFQDSGSVHLGGEYTFHLTNVDLDARAGVSFETSAVPTNYESVLTIDQNKVTTAIGGSVHWQKLRVDLVYAHVFGFDVDVNAGDARIPLISPVAANPPKTPDYINGGQYSARANIVGLGLAYTFDPSLPDPDATPPPSPAPSPGAPAPSSGGK